MRRSRRTFGILALTAVVVLSGCTTEPEPGTPSTTTSTRTSETGREPQAVLAALRRLDPCALAEPTDDTSTLAPVPRGPHRCDLDEGTATIVRVTLGVPLSKEDHPGLKPIELSGVRAYSFDDPAGCGVRIPVHPVLAIAFDGKDGVQACQQAQEIAAVAVPRLADPDAVRTTDEGAGWDACTALATVTGRFDQLVPGYGDHGVDSCGVAAGGGPGELTPIPDTRIDITYGIDPTQDTDLAGYQYTTIGDRTVRVLESECSFEWSQGFVGAQQKARVVQLVAQDCANGRSRTRALIRLLAGEPPEDVEPQDPLTYRTDEPDPICEKKPTHAWSC